MMLIRCILFFLLSHQISQTHSQTLPEITKLNVFILAGQSNMAGRGGVLNDTVTNTTLWDGVVPPESRSNPSILRLSSNLTWVLAREPLHADIDVNKTNGVGPGMPFANEIVTRVQGYGPVGLVPCAIGGTNVSEWGKGGVLYREMVKRAKAAVNGGEGGEHRAVLWYQGESDTMVEEEAKMYKERLIRFFKDLTQDLNQPDLPIIQVAIASGPGPYVDTIRKAQLKTHLPNVRCVDAKGLPLGPDGLHLTTPAQVQLGHMLADAFLRCDPKKHRTNSCFGHNNIHLSLLSSHCLIIWWFTNLYEVFE